MPLAFFCTLFFRHRKKSVSAPWDGQSLSAPESARQAPPRGRGLRLRAHLGEGIFLAFASPLRPIITQRHADCAYHISRSKPSNSGVLKAVGYCVLDCHKTIPQGQHIEFVTHIFPQLRKFKKCFIIKTKVRNRVLSRRMLYERTRGSRFTGIYPKRYFG